MYKKPFYITEPVWNNAFSYEERENKQIYVPSLIEIDDLDEIELWDEIVFEDFDFDWKLSSDYWLKNFYKISLESKCITAPIYLFDNHNHAFYFWYLSRGEGIIWDNNTLIHIDEHADTRDNDKNLYKLASYDLEKVFDFTNNVLNVWDYIIPAKNEGIIWDIIQIRNETNLRNYLKMKNNISWKIILNLDLDFFQPDLDFIDYELKKKVILDLVSKASVITVATSPFFINQKLAIKVFKDIFWN